MVRGIALVNARASSVWLPWFAGRSRRLVRLDFDAVVIKTLCCPASTGLKQRDASSEKRHPRREAGSQSYGTRLSSPGCRRRRLVGVLLAIQGRKQQCTPTYRQAGLAGRDPPAGSRDGERQPDSQVHRQNRRPAQVRDATHGAAADTQHARMDMGRRHRPAGRDVVHDLETDATARAASRLAPNRTTQTNPQRADAQTERRTGESSVEHRANGAESRLDRSRL